MMVNLCLAPYHRDMQLTELMDDIPSTTAAALDLFDGLPAAETDFMIGTWHGAELPTEHPMDGLLAASGWWGKQFVDAETVHPLLFPTPDGRALWPMNPARAFSGVPLAARVPSITSLPVAKPIAATRLLWRARSGKARLRTLRRTPLRIQEPQTPLPAARASPRWRLVTRRSTSTGPAKSAGRRPTRCGTT